MTVALRSIYAGIMDWQDEAACQFDTPDKFFPEREHRHKGSISVYDAALLVCQRCSVINECRDYAIRQDIQWGMWGGMTPDERETYHRSQGRQGYRKMINHG